MIDDAFKDKKTLTKVMKDLKIRNLNNARKTI